MKAPCLCVLSSILLSLSKWTSAQPSLSLMSTGPAVLDSPIRFQVELHGIEKEEGPFAFRWSKFSKGFSQ